MTDLDRAPILRVMPGPGRHQRQRPYLRRLGAEPDGHRRGHRRLAARAGPGRDRRDRSDEVHRADPPARPDFGLRRGRAGRPHVDGSADRSRSPTRDLGATEVKVTEGLFTFVALDASAPPDGRSATGLGRRRDLVFAFGRARTARARRRGRGAGSSSSPARHRSRPIAGGSTSRGWLSSRPFMREASSDCSSASLAERSSRLKRRGSRSRRFERASAVLALVAIGTILSLFIRSFGFGALELLVTLVVIEVVAALAALILEPGAALAQHSEIMVGELEIIFGLNAIARELRVPRHALVFFEQLGGIAALAIVLTVPRLSAEVRSPLSPTAAPAAALSIIDQMPTSLRSSRRPLWHRASRVGTFSAGS